MSEQTSYVPPRVWTWDKENGGPFGGMNRPTAGARFDRELPVGRHPIQLYSMGTPNGQKVTIMLEELLAAGHSGADYDAWLIQIRQSDQFGSGFVAINPNSKIPAMVDHSSIHHAGCSSRDRSSSTLRRSSVPSCLPTPRAGRRP